MVGGINNTFENNVRIRIVGADGRTLAKMFTTGRGPMGQWGRFDTIVPIARGSNPSGKVVAFETLGQGRKRDRAPGGGARPLRVNRARMPGALDGVRVLDLSWGIAVRSACCCSPSRAPT